MSAIAPQSQIFRYKFSEQIHCLIGEFSSIHKFDEPIQFREEWDLFVIENKEQLEREKNRLVSLGYDKNVDEKMYKSARYYFKNKPTAKKEPKKRRKYVTIDKTFLGQMDKHINEIAFVQDLKPAHAYNNFISDDKYSSKMDEIVQDLMDENDLEEAEVEKKICKTYKNRYFIQQKSKGKKDN
tara:strand:+ start:1032 stop:1580 length:549 start_codon:yes stop_codon:yes gene_type:complete